MDASQQWLYMHVYTEIGHQVRTTQINQINVPKTTNHLSTSYTLQSINMSSILTNNSKEIKICLMFKKY